MSEISFREKKPAGNPLGNMFGAIGLVGAGYYMFRQQKDLQTILIGALAGGISGYLIGAAVYRFYTFDKDYVITT